MRQILASFFCFGENLVKSNEVKTNLTKGVLLKEKFVNLLRYKNLELKMRNQDHRGRGKTPKSPIQPPQGTS